jgi:Leucine-rich repeat (LRR) protein
MANAIEGQFPLGFGQLRMLQVLDVEQNSMTGQPLDLLTVIQSLTRVRLTSNHFDGTIPTNISTWSGAQELLLADNNFTGSLPIAIGALTALESLIIYQNAISGTLPSELGNLHLVSLQAQNNSLTGEIPPLLFQNTGLEEMRLDGNNLTGSLSSSLGNLRSLRDLRVNDNQLTGTLPAGLWGLSNLGTSKCKHGCNRRFSDGGLPRLLLNSLQSSSCLLTIAFRDNFVISLATLKRSTFSMPDKTG